MSISVDVICTEQPEMGEVLILAECDVVLILRTEADDILKATIHGVTCCMQKSDASRGNKII